MEKNLIIDRLDSLGAICDKRANLEKNINSLKPFQGFNELIFSEDMEDKDMDKLLSFFENKSKIIFNFDSIQSIAISSYQFGKILEDMQIGLDRKYHNLDYFILDLDSILFMIDRLDLRRFLDANDLCDFIKYKEID